MSHWVLFQGVWLLCSTSDLTGYNKNVIMRLWLNNLFRRGALSSTRIAVGRSPITEYLNALPVAEQAAALEAFRL
jgi:hypothetical protein